MSVLKKKELVTIITPIPGFIPRQLAIDILHSHGEVITLNPLVLSHKAIKAPRDAAPDEYYSTWYEITERIQYVPGLGKMGSGKISFNGCFHDMPWGLQAHIYAPMGIDMRYKYRIGGNQPGFEPPEPLEMGMLALGAPSDGLYLREDVEVKANITVMSFVKSQLKAASKLMVQRIIKKAELVDAGALHAMIENGKLKTFNPADRSSTANIIPAPAPSPALTSSTFDADGKPSDQGSTQQDSPSSVPPPSASPGSPGPVPYQVPRRQSMMPQPYGYRPESAGISQYQQPPLSPGLGGFQAYSGYQGHPMQPGYPGNPAASAGGYYQQQQQYPQQMNPAMYGQYGAQQMAPHMQMQQQQQMSQQPFSYAELQAPPAPYASATPQGGPAPVEMAGDYYHAPPQQQPPPQQQHLTPQQEGATANKRISAELPTHNESPDEHRADALKKLSEGSPTADEKFAQRPGQNVYGASNYA